MSTLGPLDKQTVELGMGEPTTFRAAFTVRPTGPTSAMSARVEPFSQGGISRHENRTAGLTVTPGSDRASTANPIPAAVYNIPSADDIPLFPGIRISA